VRYTLAANAATATAAADAEVMIFLWG